MSEQRYPSPEQIRDQKIFARMGMTEEEFALVVEKLGGRLPNYTELGIFSVMWSEHCSYKNTRPQLKKFPTKSPRVLQGPGEGAGVIDIGEGMAVVPPWMGFGTSLMIVWVTTIRKMTTNNLTPHLDFILKESDLLKQCEVLSLKN